MGDDRCHGRTELQADAENLDSESGSAKYSFDMHVAIVRFMPRLCRQIESIRESGFQTLSIFQVFVRRIYVTPR